MRVASYPPPPARWRRLSCFESPSSSVLVTLLVIATVVFSVLFISHSGDSSSSTTSSIPWSSSSVSSFSSPFSSWSWKDDAGIRATTLPPSLDDAGPGGGSNTKGSLELHGAVQQQQQGEEGEGRKEQVRSLPSPRVRDDARWSASPSPLAPAEAPGLAPPAVRPTHFNFVFFFFPCKTLWLLLFGNSTVTHT